MTARHHRRHRRQRGTQGEGRDRFAEHWHWVKLESHLRDITIELLPSLRSVAVELQLGARIAEL